MILLDTAKNYAIGILFALTTVGGIASYVLYQKAERVAAQVQPLRDAAKEATDIAELHRKNLVQCEADKKAMREANERALEQAEKGRQEAEASAEEFRRRLANPPVDCQALLQQRICPSLRDY